MLAICRSVAQIFAEERFGEGWVGACGVGWVGGGGMGGMCWRTTVQHAPAVRL